MPKRALTQRVVRSAYYLWLLIAAALLSAAPALAAEFDYSEASTAYNVSVHDVSWHDTARNRTLPLKIRVPQGARDTPVILFSHGLSSSREGGRLWGEHWAAFGYLVIHIQHPGSDNFANARVANSLTQYLARVQDVHFVLDELFRRHAAGELLVVHADLARIGMSGHSFGAQTTLAVAGMRLGESVENGVKPLDARISAALAFSPTASGPESAESDYPSRFGAIQVPFMTVTGTEDGDASSRGYVWENRQIPFQHMPALGKYLLVLKGADHWVYGGVPGATRPVRAQDAAITRWARIATTAFWDAHLKSDMAARHQLEVFAGILGAAGSFLHK